MLDGCRLVSVPYSEPRKEGSSVMLSSKCCRLCVVDARLPCGCASSSSVLSKPLPCQGRMRPGSLIDLVTLASLATQP